MFPLATDTPLNRNQIIHVIGAMLKIAYVDEAGTADEVAMIREFYQGVQEPGTDGWPAFESIAPASPTADLFPDAAQKEMLMATCMMTAFADGIMSDKELSALKEFSSYLDVSEERFVQIMALVKDYMLMQLAGLPDAESIVKVARDLG